MSGKALSYQEACARIFALPLHTKKNPIGETKAFYEWLGRPGSGCRTFHVAGTNGKGSVCAFLSGILTGAGLRTGLFTSPHLEEIRERFVCDGKRIGEETFARLYGVLEEKLEAYGREGPGAGEGGAGAAEDPLRPPAAGRRYRPTFFETLFLLYQFWMEEEKPEFSILETGMGGLLDATNVIESPLVCVITRIGLDHCQYLGDTVEKIAAQKAGIFRPGVPAVCLDGTEGNGVREVLVRSAAEIGAPLVIVSKKEVSFSKKAKNKIDFSAESAYYKYVEACLHTEALYQAENAVLAIRALEAAGLCGRITAEQVGRGLSAMRWPGRMEEVFPAVFIDGAHNPDGIAAFLESAAADGCRGRRFLLFGASADKSTGEMFFLLKSSGLFARIEGTLLQNPRSMTEADFMRLPQWGAAAVYRDSAEGLEALLRAAGPEDRVYAAGSLYLAGEIRRFAKKRREVCCDQF